MCMSTVDWNKSVPQFVYPSLSNKAGWAFTVNCSGILLTLSLDLIPFLRYLTSKFSGFDIDLQRSLEVKNISTIRKPIHDFLSKFHWHFLSHTVFEIFDFKVYCFGVLNVNVNIDWNKCSSLFCPSPSNKAGWAFTVNWSGIINMYTRSICH